MSEVIKCIHCKKRIPKARLEFLPGTLTCVKCSTVEAKVGITVWDKTTPELVIVDESAAKVFKHLENLDGRLGRL